MRFPTEQVAELARLCPGVQQAEVGGVTVFRIPALPLPEGCTPDAVEALLYPAPRDGYTSRLFFAERVQGGPSRNWNGSLSSVVAAGARSRGRPLRTSDWPRWSWFT